MLTPAQEAALALLRTPASFAVIGVSAQPEKCGRSLPDRGRAGDPRRLPGGRAARLADAGGKP